MTGIMTKPFGERLKALREQSGLSQAELAAHAGQSLRSIQNWEQGHREPKAVALLALARALGVSMEFLIEEPTKPKGK
jgi:transcriptional regulator with XRE-family HTH domain